MCKPTTASPKGGENNEATATTKDNRSTNKSFLPSVEIELSDFFDVSKPWLLVQDGNYKGYFNNVPAVFRVGPWNIACCLYLFAIISWVVFECVCCYTNPPNVPPTDYHSSFGTDTWQWWYNVAGFAWTFYVAAKVKKDWGWSAWFLYTMQSWTLIIVRHGLSVLAPFVPAAAPLNELLRFPMLLQTTITFVLWNFLLMPAITFTMKDPKKRSGFLKFCFGFLLSQLHIANLPLAVMNGVWGSPARELNQMDFCMALGLALQYIALYLFVLDRIGVHFYFVFSPRTPLAIIGWTTFLGCLFAGFAMFKNALVDYGVAA
ncbi:expressed unknown protein [Seminavis robusta]|uniref:Uncharacterized protein n=1 Tax=Seminavis robusta TaxID=568900 RepID=A0A9N8DX33_9STRA|nr:expressed unknown protein [Seminavis robusta]|eukprot:Sro347_g122830.1 n/a (318) ;mRNA; r:8877-9830